MTKSAQEAEHLTQEKRRDTHAVRRAARAPAAVSSSPDSRARRSQAARPGPSRLQNKHLK